jgi:sec-independent protein translocase protein TatA
MPSIGFGEIIVILLVALIVFGPKKLPEIGRTLGKSMREFRRATSNLKREFEESVDDEPPTVPSPHARRQQANGDPPAAADDDAD